MSDPTYDADEINANPLWRQAFQLSEMHNYQAPLNWSWWIPMAGEMLRIQGGEDHPINFRTMKKVALKKALRVR